MELQKQDRKPYICILGMLTAFGPMCSDIYLPALPEIVNALETNTSMAQTTLAATFLGLAVGQLIIGPLSDAYGRKPMLAWSLVLFIITSALCAMAIDIGMLITFRFFQGAAGAGGIVLSRAIACDLFEGEALTKFMSLLMTVNSVAPMVGPLVGASLTAFGSFRVIFWFLAVWGVTLLLASQMRLAETCTVDRSRPALRIALGGMCAELRNVRFLLMALSLSVSMSGFFGYLAASPFVFQEIYGYSSWGYSAIFALNTMAISVLGLLAGFHAKRIGNLLVVKGSIAAMLICGALLTYLALDPPQSSVPVALLLLVFVGMVGPSQAAGFAVAMGTAKGAAGSASGIFGVMSYAAGALITPVVGVMGDTSMLPLGLCMLLTALMALLLFRAGLRGLDQSKL